MSPAAVNSYVKDERTKAHRINKRVHYDEENVHSIMNGTPILHVSFNGKPFEGTQFPTILPMLGWVGQHDSDDEAHIYLHGSSTARLMKITNGNEVPMCVAATIIDGYVLTLAPFHNSCNYRSAICFGYGYLLEDPDEIMFALRNITNHTVPNRWENSRSEPTKAELTSTGVLKFRIETASAKVRDGGGDEDRLDLQNEKLYNNTWCGVVPSYQTIGTPLAAEYNRVQQVPEYMEDWIADENSLNEQKAVDAAMSAETDYS